MIDILQTSECLIRKNYIGYYRQTTVFPGLRRIVMTIPGERLSIRLFRPPSFTSTTSEYACEALDYGFIVITQCQLTYDTPISCITLSNREERGISDLMTFKNAIVGATMKVLIVNGYNIGSGQDDMIETCETPSFTARIKFALETQVSRTRIIHGSKYLTPHHHTTQRSRENG